MRVVIDMQGAQTAFSRHRGVGRYTLEMAKAIIKSKQPEDEVYLACNGGFGDAVEYIREEFEPLIGSERIKVWQQLFNTTAIVKSNYSRMKVGEYWREYFLNSLSPDVIFSTNLQEGFFESAVTSCGVVKSNAKYATTLHDVTPLLYSDKYLTDSVTKAWYESKLEYVKKSDIVFTVSNYSKKMISKHLGIDEEKIFVTYNAVDDEKFKPILIDDEVKRNILAKYGINKGFILYVGGADEHKNLTRLYEAFSKLPPNILSNYELVMVGKELKSSETKERYVAKKFNIDHKINFPDFVPDNDLVYLYNLCDLFVCPSYSEGFGIPPLEAIKCGALTITSNRSSLPEVVGNKEATFNPFDAEDIARKIEISLTDKHFREDLLRKEKEYASKFSWDISGEVFWYGVRDVKRNRVDEDLTHDCKCAIKVLKKCSELKNLDDESKKSLSLSMTETLPDDSNRKKHIFLDVSATVYEDHKTGIQRVARAISNEMFMMESEYEFDIVYSTPYDLEYYRADKIINQITGNSNVTDKEWVDILPGDIILSMDLHPSLVNAQREKVKYLMNKGVRVYHMVYDILPVLNSRYHPEEFIDDFRENWLNNVLKTNGVIAISKYVAETVLQYMEKNGFNRRNFDIGYFHLGADVKSSLPSKGIPTNAKDIFKKMSESKTFLMVGTIEPRKGHRQILRVMDSCWKEGKNFNLVIVGRLGWQMDDFADVINKHPKNNVRLFWLNNVSDEYLTELYKRSTCLIAASEGEGFGLPLIEAAKYGIPIFARDLQVFKEVAGENAFYFDGSNDEVLMNDLLKWCNLYDNKMHPESIGMKYLTWKESAEWLYEVVVGNKWWKRL